MTPGAPIRTRLAALLFIAGCQGAPAAPDAPATVVADARSGDASVPQASRIGVFRPSDRTWTLDNGNGTFDGCETDPCMTFGQAGDLGVTGDWAGTGTRAIAVFRPSDRSWTLDNGNGTFDGCGVDTCRFFGGPGDLPVVGDWSGLGRSAIGVFRPADRAWTLDTNGNGTFDGCAVDTCIPEFGAPDDVPVTGDWRGTGKTEIGVFRPSDRTWTLDSNGNGVFDGCEVDTCLAPFGRSGDVPITGDWLGTGTTAVGVFRPSDQTWTLDNGNGVFDGCEIDRCLPAFGRTGDLPVRAR